MKKAASILLMAFLVICLCCCGKQPEEPFVVKIGSEKVYSPEFRFYFLLSQMAFESAGGSDIWLTTMNGEMTEEVAKNRSLESISRIKISGMQAASLGIDLTDSDKETAGVYASFYYHTMFNENIMNEIGMKEDLLRSMMEETVIYQKVFDEITKNVQISEKEFNIYFENYLEELQPGESEPNIESLRETQRSKYTNEIKREVFAGEYSKWEANTKIEKNMEVFDAIHILEY